MDRENNRRRRYNRQEKPSPMAEPVEDLREKLNRMRLDKGEPLDQDQEEHYYLPLPDSNKADSTAMERQNNRPRQYRHRKSEPVEDLREKLNRMRLDKGEPLDQNQEEDKKNLPPPDPKYNFLKDPLRGDRLESVARQKKAIFKNEQRKNPEERQLHENKHESLLSEDENRAQFDRKKKEHPEIQIWQRRHTDKRQWHENSAPEKGNSKHENDKNYSSVRPTIEMSMIKKLSQNINVEFSSSTGERRCIIDDIKMVNVPKSTNDAQNPVSTNDDFLKNSKQKHRPPRKNRRNIENIEDASEMYDKGTPKFKRHHHYKKYQTNQKVDMQDNARQSVNVSSNEKTVEQIYQELEKENKLKEQKNKVIGSDSLKKECEANNENQEEKNDP